MGGGDNPVDLERNRTSNELALQLVKAQWHPTPAVLHCVGIGMRIHLDPLADSRTQLAAQQLANVLHDALLLSEKDDPRITTLSLSQDLPEYPNHDNVHSFVVVVNNNPFQ
jgi:hypothetical protein